jgi:hypothetical protein
MRRVGLGIALAACAAAEAAEPTAVVPPAQTTPPAAAVPAPANPKPAIEAATQKPLDLRIGDVRKYMMPNEFRAAIDAPDAEANTVVVEGKRELLPVQYEKPIPVGPLMPLFWGLMHPTQSWRIFLPDLNRAADGPPDVVPPPVFRWGP